MDAQDKTEKPELPALVVLSFGSNCGDRSKNVEKALDWIKGISSGAVCSIIYETPEIHGIGAPYMNAVCRCHISYSLTQFLAITKEYETVNGRDSECRIRGEVPIDIDVVIWNDKIIRPKDYSCSFFQIGYKMIESGTSYCKPND